MGNKNEEILRIIHLTRIIRKKLYKRFRKLKHLRIVIVTNK